jgi:hypothetical protein
MYSAATKRIAGYIMKHTEYEGKRMQIELMIEKYLNGTASEEEIKLVNDWYASFEINPGIQEKYEARQLHKSLQHNWNIIKKALKI